MHIERYGKWQRINSVLYVSCLVKMIGDWNTRIRRSQELSCVWELRNIFLSFVRSTLQWHWLRSIHKLDEYQHTRSESPCQFNVAEFARKIRLWDSQLPANNKTWFLILRTESLLLLINTRYKFSSFENSIPFSRRTHEWRLQLTYTQRHFTSALKPLH
jgi:hypothetical protein